MAVRSLRFVLTGEDKSASKALGRVGKNAKQLDSHLGSLAAGVAGGALGAGIVSFGKSSVAAFKEAEHAQASFSAAFQKFPKLADINAEALSNYNSALAKKTRFDDDAIGSGQAVLAQFDLTGQQIKQITPLLLDYAAKTGQDLPTAAKALGLATMGNAKALKQVGIALPKTISGAKALEAAQKDVTRTEDRLTSARRKLNDVQDLLRGKTKLTTAETIRLRNAQFGVKDAEENHAISVKRLGEAQKGAGKSADVFAQIMGGLRTQVGGFAEKEGKTAAGQSEILKNQFGELQETVGSKLVPALTKGAGALLGVIDFTQRNSKVIKPLVITIGGLAAAVWTVNKATAAWKATETAFLTVKGLFTAATVAETAAAGSATAATTTLAAAETAAGVAGARAAAGVGALAGAEVAAGTAGVGAAAGLGTVATAAGALVAPVVVATGAVLALVKLLKWMDEHPDARKNLLAGSPSATIDLPGKPSPTITFDGRTIPRGPVPAPTKRNFGLAKGGPMKAGFTYLTGEQGPELITARRSAFVHNNRDTHSIFNKAARLDASQVVDNRLMSSMMMTPLSPYGRVHQGAAPTGLNNYIVVKVEQSRSKTSKAVTTEGRRRARNGHPMPFGL